MGIIWTTKIIPAPASPPPKKKLWICSRAGNCKRLHNSEGLFSGAPFFTFILFQSIKFIYIDIKSAVKMVEEASDNESEENRFLSGEESFLRPLQLSMAYKSNRKYMKEASVN